MRSLARLVAIASLALVAAEVSPAAAASPQGARLARSSEGLFWFMHVSDAHIGANSILEPNGANASAQFTFALGSGVNVIKPTFVWATGDLQDGSGKVGIAPYGTPTSGQGQWQWDRYKAIYTAAGMRPGFYFDLPGNHDVYGDQGATFFLANSLTGSMTGKTWHAFTVSTSTGKYGFFGMNSTKNYFRPLSNCCPGFLPDEIGELQRWFRANPDLKLAFVAAHHMLSGNGSSTVENADQVRAILKEQKAFYLHGDVHEYDQYLDSGEIVAQQVNAIGKADVDNIAVGVVDHDAFVYRATSVKKPWPFAVVTAPASEKLLNGSANPYAYAVCKDRADTPFRAVSFSSSAPTKVTLKVGSLAEVPMRPARGAFDASYPVWQAELDTRALASGSTKVSVTVEADGAKNVHEITARFSDGPCAPLEGDAPPPGVDAGAPVADAGLGADAGSGAVVTVDDGSSGGGCAYGRRGSSSSAAFGVVAFGLVVGARRRRVARATS